MSSIENQQGNLGSSNPAPYNVVFRYTSKSGGYEGVVFYTSFETREDFERWKTGEGRKVLKTQEVIAEGITSKECQDLASSTPFDASLRAAFSEARGRNGVLNRKILEMELTNLMVDHSGRPLSPGEIEQSLIVIGEEEAKDKRNRKDSN